MLEVTKDNMDIYFLCNSNQDCHTSVGCHNDCHLTKKEEYAKNIESVILLNDFMERFCLLIMEDGTLIVSERER